MDNVDPFAIVKTAVVPGLVIVTLLTVVADAAPSVGVTSTGPVAKTIVPPDPVTELPCAVIVPDVGSVKDVVPVAVNVCPKAPACVTLPAVESVDPLASVRTAVVPGLVIVTLLMVVAEAAPIVGVVSVGLVARTMLPLPCGATPKAVKTVLFVVTVAGAAPAPPPTTMAFAAKAADDNHVVPLLK